MDPLIARLNFRGTYPDNGRVDGISAAEDWGNAKMEIDRLTAERDELLTILRDVLCRGWDDTAIEVAYPADVDLRPIHPSLEKWIPRA